MDHTTSGNDPKTHSEPGCRGRLALGAPRTWSPEELGLLGGRGEGGEARSDFFPGVGLRRQFF